MVRLSLVSLLVAGAARAAGDEERDAAAARTLFFEGRELAAKGDYEAACPKFEESQRLQPGIGTLFNLADCWEHVGRTASAWARFLDVAALAQRSQQYDREQVARQRAAELEPKLARLTVEIAEPVEGLELRRSGLVIGRALWNTPVPVDPGAYTITASAPSKRAFSVAIQIDPSERETVQVPPLEAMPLAPVAPAPAAAPPVAPAPPPPPAVDRSFEQRSTPTLVYVLGGVALAGLAVGTTFGLIARSKNEDALAKCTGGRDGNECSDAEEERAHNELVNDAKDARTVALVSLAIGGAALIGGGVVFFLQPAPSRSAEQSRGFTGATLSAVARF
jgi:hypothetical protein